MILPEPGLIVSCYLHSMKGCEQKLIEVLWDMDEVKTLRIEGAENLALARKLKDIKDKYVIGLIKDKDAEAVGKPYITANIDNVKKVIDSGVDMVAVDGRAKKYDNLTQYCQLYETNFPVMCDVENECEAVLAHYLGALIIATTFSSTVFSLSKSLTQKGIKVNVEGGLTSQHDIKAAFENGASWCTIGRAIHNPPTIIRQFLSQIPIKAEIALSNRYTFNYLSKSFSLGSIKNYENNNNS